MSKEILLRVKIFSKEYHSLIAMKKYKERGKKLERKRQNTKKENQ